MSNVRHLNQSARDAEDLAEALMTGDGMEALEVIFCGSYEKRADLAQLLRSAADLLEDA